MTLHPSAGPSPRSVGGVGVRENGKVVLAVARSLAGDDATAAARKMGGRPTNARREDGGVEKTTSARGHAIPAAVPLQREAQLLHSARRNQRAVDCGAGRNIVFVVSGIVVVVRPEGVETNVKGFVKKEIFVDELRLRFSEQIRRRRRAAREAVAIGVLLVVVIVHILFDI